MCEYCRQFNECVITGKELLVNKTNTVLSKLHSDTLNCYIMKGTQDKSSAIMIGTCEGFHYIDIKYCPMCGREL